MYKYFGWIFAALTSLTLSAFATETDDESTEVVLNLDEIDSDTEVETPESD